MRTFEVTEARLLQLLQAEDFETALNQEEVDSWPGYDNAAFNDDIQDATDTVPEEYISHGITLIKE